MHFDCRIFTFINIFRDTNKNKKIKKHSLRNTGNTLLERISVPTASLSGRVYGFPPLLNWKIIESIECVGVWDVPGMASLTLPSVCWALLFLFVVVFAEGELSSSFHFGYTTTAGREHSCRLL